MYDTAEYVKQSFDHNATGLNALQWDTAELKEIGVTSEMKYHEAFIVEEVSSHTGSINYVCSYDDSL